MFTLNNELAWMSRTLAKRGTNRPGDFVETLNFLSIAHSHNE